MSKIKFTALVDVDHTLSNAFWRDGMMDDWNVYHSASVDDRPMTDIVALCNALHKANWRIIGITARPERWRKITMEWMVKHSVQLDELLMRADDDYRIAPEIKMQLAKNRFGNTMKQEVTVIFDDRDDVVAAFAAEGITAVQVSGRKD